MEKIVKKKDVKKYLDDKLKKIKENATYMNYDEIKEPTTEEIRQSISEIVNDPVFNQLFKNLSEK